MASNLPEGHDCREAACSVLLVIANSQLAFTRVPGKQMVSCMGTDGSVYQAGS